MNTSTAINAMTVDVEEHFQVAALANSFSRDDWDSIESRVENNTNRLLDIFAEHDVKATFFVLGWIAERHPALTRRIVSDGHELACHGYSHSLVYEQTPVQFLQETKQAKAILEEVGGVAVRGYRAASYSITAKSEWAVDMLVECGFTFDSSIVPARHDLYGVTNAHPFPHELRTPSGGSIVEFPPSTIRLAGRRVPVGGGGYFRLFPYWFTRWALSRIHKDDDQPFVFYLHPWEVDPSQPRVKASWKSQFRHYNNLEKCERRFVQLLRDFRFDSMSGVLERQENKPVIDWMPAGSIAG